MYQRGTELTSLTTTDGVEYTLEFDGFYKWKTKGKVAECLASAYTGPHDAITAFNMYNSSLTLGVNTGAAQKPLEELTSKADLMGYAKAKGIDVPEKYKQPSAIKKFLEGGYDA